MTEEQQQTYTTTKTWIQSRITAAHPMLFSRPIFHAELSATSRHLCTPYEALHSQFRNAHLLHMKRNGHTVKSQTTRHVQSYLNGNSILNIAKRVNYPPCWMARLIIENVAVLPSSNTTKNSSTNTNNMNGNAKKFITEAIRHPEKVLGDAKAAIVKEYLFSEGKGRGTGRKDHDGERVPLSRLAIEVREAVGSDPMYGPDHDKIRHNIGVEYELLLEQLLDSMKIPFETEEHLRARGTAKTPDILLSCPLGMKVSKKRTNEATNQIAVENDDESEWKMICWIDSKALYGDVETHTNSVLPQVESYIHRFGPGLVIYWFGHAPLSMLGDSHGDVMIVDDLPEVFMLPTGEFRRR